ncbi:MAG: hypothetical protein BJBARM4_0338, partial [Candidatus Parvarchaeum acidiphilum ARMAN-4]
IGMTHTMSLSPPLIIFTWGHEGELAKNCANNIFKGQQIIFV